MINKLVDNAVFDAVLRKAFTEAFAREVAEIEAQPSAAESLPEKYRRAERKYYNKKMKQSSGTYAVLRKIAACILICLSVGFAALMAIPTVRASVWDSVVNFYEKYIKFDFNVTSVGEETIGEYTLGYVPDGFVRTSAAETNAKHKYRFENEEYVFTIRYYYSKNCLSYDDEKGKVYIVKINGTDGYMVEYLDGTYTLVWKNKNAVFFVDGNISSKEIIKIAENIS
ncbi:MAG: DUF4367 domain-containing protein [Clostridia bacterium]|nr:DUF4367 domain-containing protein [Clostridia bacterium]